MAPAQLEQIHPPRPAPVKLYDPPWKICGDNVCLTPREAERDLRNKVEIGRFIFEAQSLINYYRREEIEQPE